LKIHTRSAATVTLLLAGLAASPWIEPCEAQVAKPFAAEQVSCQADELRGLLGRSALLFGPFYDDRTAMFLFTFGAPSRTVRGIGLMEQSDRSGAVNGPERQIAFELSPAWPRLQRNPTRPPLNAIYLLRDPLGSDLGAAEDPFAMAVVIDSTADPLHNQDPNTLLVIDNLTAREGGTASATKAGRALSALLDRCHSEFTAADLRVFDILSRVVRATIFPTHSTDPRALRMHKLATIYRGEEAEPIAGGVRASYRIDLYPVGDGTPARRVSLEVKIELGDDGRLGDATLRVLPLCASPNDRGCSTSTTETQVAIIRPAASNRVWQGTSPTVCWNGGASCPSETSFSFADRLADTAWQQP